MISNTSLTTYCQDVDLNELIYFEIFNCIANKVTTIPNKWKELCNALFKNYPSSIPEKIIGYANNSYTTDKEKAFKVLIHWKIYNANQNQKMINLKTAVNEVLPEVAIKLKDEIDHIINEHEKQSQTQPKGNCDSLVLNRVISNAYI